MSCFCKAVDTCELLYLVAFFLPVSGLALTAALDAFIGTCEARVAATYHGFKG